MIQDKLDADILSGKLNLKDIEKTDVGKALVDVIVQHLEREVHKMDNHGLVVTKGYRSLRNGFIELLMGKRAQEILASAWTLPTGYAVAVTVPAQKLPLGLAWMRLTS